jgi:hypothetical protein
VESVEDLLDHADESTLNLGRDGEVRHEGHLLKEILPERFDPVGSIVAPIGQLLKLILLAGPSTPGRSVSTSSLAQGSKAIG